MKISTYNRKKQKSWIIEQHDLKMKNDGKKHIKNLITIVLDEFFVGTSLKKRIIFLLIKSINGLEDNNIWKKYR